MDLNLVVLCGKLAAPIEHRVFESGASFARILLTVKSDYPEPRVDVVPVTIHGPSEELIEEIGVVGNRVWIAGRISRRFWQTGLGRGSRLEVVASVVEPKKDSETVEV